MINENPKRSRPQIKDYGIPADDEGMLEWRDILEQLQKSRNYWLVTVRPNGQPHAMPVWGVLVDGALHFGMGRWTRKAQNIASNPKVVIHLDSSEEVVIIEGTAEEVLDEGQQKRIDAAYEEKYQIRHGTPVYALRPKVAFAWNDYPKTTTRWHFTEE